MSYSGKIEDLIAERDSLRKQVMSSEGEWVGHKTLASLRKDAERYRKLVAPGKFSVPFIGGSWGLACGSARWTKDELDAAADALPAVGAA